MGFAICSCAGLQIIFHEITDIGKSLNKLQTLGLTICGSACPNDVTTFFEKWEDPEVNNVWLYVSWEFYLIDWLSVKKKHLDDMFVCY